MRQANRVPWLLSMFISILLLMLAAYPEQVFMAAAQGVSIWWSILFPALFPFFIIAELLLGFGIVHFFGRLLDPIMRPLFRVPGIGGFVMALGFASGYPVGARMTSQLYEQGMITRDEGERLVAFTSTADPIFLIGAVAVGFFHNATLGLIILCAHYGSGVIVGLLMRFHGAPSVTHNTTLGVKRPILMEAFDAMHRARLEHQRPVGELLQQAVATSLRLVFVIGGLVVFFSTIITLLTESHVIRALNVPITNVLALLHLPGGLSTIFVNGFFEVTLGARHAGAASESIPLVHKVAAAAFVLSWGGLSVHAQIASLLSHTTLRYQPFFIARLIHGILASISVYLLWPLLQPAERMNSSETNLPVLSLSQDQILSAPTYWFYGAAAGLIILFAALIILLFSSFIMRTSTRKP